MHRAAVCVLFLCQICSSANVNPCKSECVKKFESCEQSCPDEQSDRCKCKQQQEDCMGACRHRAEQHGVEVEITQKGHDTQVDMTVQRQDTGGKKEDNTTLYIVLGVLGGVVLLLVVALLLAFCIIRTNRKRRMGMTTATTTVSVFDRQRQLGGTPVYPAPVQPPPAQDDEKKQSTVAATPQGCATCAAKGRTCDKCAKKTEKSAKKTDKKDASKLSPSATKYTTDR